MALSGAAPQPFGFLAFRICSARFPVLPSCFSVLSLSVSFLSSLPVSLPQPLLRCFPCFRFRAFPSDSLSYQSLIFGSDYSAIRSFLSLLPVLPCRRFLRCFFPLSSGLFPCLPSDFGTQLSAVPFSVHCLASQWLPQCLGLPFRARPPPLGLRFRFVYLALECALFRHLLVASFLSLSNPIPR